MLKKFYDYKKLLIYLIPFLAFSIIINMDDIHSSLIYSLFLAYIVCLFIYDLFMTRNKHTKNEELVNVIEDMAKGKLVAEISIGEATRKNLQIIENNLSEMINYYTKSNYEIEKIKEKQRGMLSKYKEIALFFITDETGQQIHNSTGKKLVNNSDRDYFIKAKKTGKPQVSDIVISKITDKLAVVVAVPYFRQDKFMGVFATTIDMQGVSTSEEKMGNALLGTLGSLKKLVYDVQNSAQQVANSATALSSISQQSAEASESVAASSSEVVKDSEEQLSEILSVTSGIQQITASIQEILANAEEIRGVSETANESVSLAEKEVNSAIQSMNDLEESSKKVHISLDEINKSSAKMDEIVQVIQSIAEQTNLLALNASIEAARAGEAGKGFSVVADEIRKLAENSKRSTVEIYSLIQEIQLKIKETNHDVDQNNAIVKAGTENVNQTGNTLKEIIRFVHVVDEQIISITEAINEVASGSQNVSTSTSIIQEKSKNVAEEIQNVSAAAEEQTAAVQEIASASNILTGLATELQKSASNFQIAK